MSIEVDSFGHMLWWNYLRNSLFIMNLSSCFSQESLKEVMRTPFCTTKKFAFFAVLHFLTIHQNEVVFTGGPFVSCCF